jgi:hypothetical protein
MEPGFKGQSAISFTTEKGEYLDLIVDWYLAPGLNASLNIQEEPPEAHVENGWIEEEGIMSPMSDALLDEVNQDPDFQDRLMVMIEEEFQNRIEDKADQDLDRKADLEMEF